MKKQNIVIIAVIALVLVLAVGYALFSETLTITGTATATASFDVEFYSIGQETSAGYTKQTTSPTHQLAQISADKNAVVIRVNKLDYPGAYVEIPITIKNVGSLRATLNSVNLTGWDGDDTPIRITYKYGNTSFDELSDIAAADRELDPQGTKVITVRVEWVDSNPVQTSAETANPAHFNTTNNNTVEGTSQFTITLGYQQSSNQATS